MLRVARSCQYVLSEPRPRVMMTELGDFAKVFDSSFGLVIIMMKLLLETI